MRTLMIVLFVVLCPRFVAADASRRIEKEVVVNGSIGTVWNAWTTAEGAKSFFAPSSKIELRPGGAYEMYFVESQPEGLKGGEGNRIVDYEPEKLLLFTWNAPPKFGPLRNERTFVMVRFEPVGDLKTRVRLTHFGWRDAAGWDAVYAYFESAWDVVLRRLAGVNFGR